MNATSNEESIKLLKTNQKMHTPKLKQKHLADMDILN